MTKKFNEKNSIAVALNYEASIDDAPVVGAHGRLETAKKMISLARRYGIPIAKESMVAEELTRVKVNQEIPPELYVDVSKILKRVKKI